MLDPFRRAADAQNEQAARIREARVLGCNRATSAISAASAPNKIKIIFTTLVSVSSPRQKDRAGFHQNLTSSSPKIISAITATAVTLFCNVKCRTGLDALGGSFVSGGLTPARLSKLSAPHHLVPFTSGGSKGFAFEGQRPLMASSTLATSTFTGRVATGSQSLFCSGVHYAVGMWEPTPLGNHPP